MKNIAIIGAFSALVTGAMIGTQATLSSRIGGLIGPTRTGLLTNVFGGVTAGIIVAALLLIQGFGAWSVPRATMLALWFSGSLGVLIVTGVSFSLGRIGVTAGLAAIILGQLLVSVVVDAMGWGGIEPIALNIRRLAGLLIMAVAVYLLLPRS